MKRIIATAAALSAATGAIVFWPAQPDPLIIQLFVNGRYFCDIPTFVYDPFAKTLVVECLDVIFGDSFE